MHATDTTCLQGTAARLPFFYPTFFLHSLFFSLLSPIIDLQRTQSFPAFFSSFVRRLKTAYLFPCPSVYFFISLCIPLLSFLVSQPLPPARHLSQQSRPFHSGEGTNGIPAESVAAGGEQRLFCDADSNLSSLHQVPISSTHTYVYMCEGPSQDGTLTLLLFTECETVMLRRDDGERRRSCFHNDFVS